MEGFMRGLMPLTSHEALYGSSCHPERSEGSGLNAIEPRMKPSMLRIIKMIENAERYVIIWHHLIFSIDYRFISNIQRKEIMHLRVRRGTPRGYPHLRGYPGWLCTVALLLMLFSALLVIIAGPSSVQAHNAVRIETPTATPDANQILNQENAIATQAASASSQANQASMEAQSMLNIFTTLITFAAFIIALVFAVLGIVGFGTIGD